MALDVASESPPKERREDRESTGPTGRIAHRAILEIGTRIDRLLVAMGRIRGRSDAPEWLLGELLGIGNDLAGTKQLRDSVSGFVTKRRHPLKRVGLDGLFKWLHAECAESLARQGIRLEVTKEPGAPDLQADAFLLRCALRGLVRRSQNALAAGSGGLIRVAAKSGEASVHIIVAHQTRERRDPESAVRGDDSELALVEAVLEHFGGASKLFLSGDNGNQATLVLPAQPDDRAAVDRVIPTAAAAAIPQDEESRIAVP